MVGATVGNYRVDRLLGSGGMGAVYLLRHRQLPNTFAALKVLKVTTREMRDRFLQEAMVAAAVGGHRVARPLDLGRLDDGTPYTVMEYLEGSTLASRLEVERVLPATTA